MAMEAKELEKKVSEHDDAINQNILPRIEKLETEFHEKVTALTNDVVRVQTGQAELVKGQKELELTVVKDGQANRDVIKETKDITNKLLDHVLRVDEKEKDIESEIVRKFNSLGFLINSTGTSYAHIFNVVKADSAFLCGFPCTQCHIV